MEIDNTTILGFVLILTRIGAFFAASPLFSWQAIPTQAKVVIALVLAAFFAMLTPAPAPAATLGAATLRIVEETCYGLALGLVAYCLLAVIRIAGGIIEQEMGLTMAGIMDPFTDEEAQPVGTMLEIIFVLLLFATDGHHLMLQILNRSFASHVPGAAPTAAALADNVIQASSIMMMLAMQLSAPLLAAFMLMVVVLAFMARVAPEANVLFLSLPLRCGLGLLMIGIFLPFLAGFLKQFTAWLDKLIPI